MGTAGLVFVFVAYILLARRDLGAARITRNFGVMIDEEGLALRGTFVINPEGQIKQCEARQRPGAGQQLSDPMIYVFRTGTSRA